MSYNKQINIIFKELGISRPRKNKDLPSYSTISMDGQSGIRQLPPKKIPKVDDKWVKYIKRMGWGEHTDRKKLPKNNSLDYSEW